MKNTLRSEDCQSRYENHLEIHRNLGKCPICGEVSKKDFKYWRIIKNSFPYDRIAMLHEILLPIRHVVEADLTEEEIGEFKEIKQNYINGHYDLMMEPVERGKSIHDHWHLHLVVLKNL